MWSRWNFSGASELSAGTGPPPVVPTPSAKTGIPSARRLFVAASRSPSPLSPSLTSSTARWPRSPSCSNTLPAVASAVPRSVAGIGEVVGTGGVEEQLERRVIGGERELEERAAAEHDEPHPVARRGRHRLPRRRLGGREPARRHVGHRHRAREVEHQQQVAAACAPARPGARRAAGARARRGRARARRAEARRAAGRRRASPSVEPRAQHRPARRTRASSASRRRRPPSSARAAQRHQHQRRGAAPAARRSSRQAPEARGAEQRRPPRAAPAPARARRRTARGSRGSR